MTKITDKNIDAYCRFYSSQPDRVLKNLEKYTRKNFEYSQMIVGGQVAAFLVFLLKISGAKTVLEIGTFTGYSALAMARALPKDGQVITLDLDKKCVKTAKKFWAKTRHGKKIKSIIANARKAIAKLKKDKARFDLIFIDADKESYIYYFKQAKRMLNPRGFIVVDNCLWSGRVLDKKAKDSSTKGIKKFNNYIRKQKRYTKTLLPFRDGLYLITKN